MSTYAPVPEMALLLLPGPPAPPQPSSASLVEGESEPAWLAGVGSAVWNQPWPPLVLWDLGEGRPPELTLLLI